MLVGGRHYEVEAPNHRTSASRARTGPLTPWPSENFAGRAAATLLAALGTVMLTPSVAARTVVERVGSAALGLVVPEEVRVAPLWRLLAQWHWTAAPAVEPQRLLSSVPCCHQSHGCDCACAHSVAQRGNAPPSMRMNCCTCGRRWQPRRPRRPTGDPPSSNRAARRSARASLARKGRAPDDPADMLTRLLGWQEACSKLTSMSACALHPCSNQDIR